MFKPVKRVPKWAWYASGGAAVAGGLVYLRSRHTVSPADGTANADSTGAVGYTAAQNMPGIIVVPQGDNNETPSDSGVNTELSALYIDSISSLFAQAQDWSSQLLDTLLGTGGGPLTGGGATSTGGTQETGGTVTVATPSQPAVTAPPPPPPPPPPAPAPAPAPEPTMPAGFTPGACPGGFCLPSLMVGFMGQPKAYRGPISSGSNSNGAYNTWEFWFQTGSFQQLAKANFYYSGAKKGTWVGLF